MSVVDKYNKIFKNANGIGSDLQLIRCTEKLMVGSDKDGFSVIVLVKDNKGSYSISQKTKMLSVDCNVKAKYTIAGKVKESYVHIIRCLSKDWKEREIFIELSTVFLDSMKDDNDEESIMDTFSTLTLFFAEKDEPSDEELRGMYTELYTIWSYRNVIDLSKYWQSQDRMKFDFSISDKFKLEIKSTIKDERRHHFRHEQLVNSLCTIYILSYLLRTDDKGLSMYDLLLKCKQLFFEEPKKLMRIDNILNRTSKEKLEKIKFSENDLQSKRKIFMAKDIPRFNEETPNGLANVEYDCILENVSSVDENIFIETIKTAIIENIGE